MDKIEIELDIDDVLALIEYHDKYVSRYQFLKNPSAKELAAQNVHNKKLGYFKKVLNENWPE